MRKHRALLLLGALLAGCSGPPGPAGDGGVGDGGVGDMLVGPTDLALGPIQTGTIGAACKDDTDCAKVSGNRVCFRDYLLNSPSFQRTPGGYCSAYCTTQRDCGQKGVCVDVGFPTTICLASCNRSGICRGGYACTIDDGVCIPADRLTCDPTASGGSCQAQVELDPMEPKVPGGCIRQAYENLGRCAPTCTIGLGSCPVDPLERVTQHCVYMDTTVSLQLKPTADQWKGLVCMHDIAPSVGEGKPCSYFEQCQEGLECDLWPGGSGRCYPLCVQGGAPMCAAGTTCQDQLHAGTEAGAVGLCK